MRWFKKRSWEAKYARCIYDGLVAHNNLGDITALSAQAGCGLLRQTEREPQSSEMEDKLAKLGVTPKLSVEDFGKVFDKDLAATVQLGRDAGIVPAD